MKLPHTKYYLVLALTSCFYACMETSHSGVYQKLLESDLSPLESGKAKFLYGDMGGIFPHTLKTNAFVYKITVLALKEADSSLPDKPAPSLFAKYGFAFPKKVWNWEKAPLPGDDKPTGLIFGKISGTHPTKGKYYFEVADFGCGSCHGSLLYGKDGNPTGQYALGMPNASLNLDAFAHDVFKGYRIIIQWSNKMFEQRMLALYPEIPKQEMAGLKIVFHSMKKQVKKIIETRGVVASYKIGGPGMVNGIGAIKSGLGMLDNSVYNKSEVSLVNIPALAGRSYRSSLLVSGNYTPLNNDFFYEISSKDTNYQHDQEMAVIISLFTIGTMGYNAEMAKKSIPDIKKVMDFLSKLETPPFPGTINVEKSEKGRVVFQRDCQSCHGKYEGTPLRNALASFPNKFIPVTEIKTDSVRCMALTGDNIKKLHKIYLGKYVDARVNKGYVAPILSGLWATAPYLHNGSVPTIWHLMHPESRPGKFYCGGHGLDYEKLGIRGEMRDGIYKYPEGYRPFSDYEIYDTKETGLSNSGHAEQFEQLTEQEKDYLLEFLKTL